MKLIRFGSKDCVFCRAMDRAGTLNHFWFPHPELTVEKVEIDGRDDLIDAHGIRYLPVLIFFASTGEELIRSKPTDGRSVTAIELLYQRAKEVAAKKNLT
jgi:hypothetical protein